MLGISDSRLAGFRNSSLGRWLISMALASAATPFLANSNAFVPVWLVLTVCVRLAFQTLAVMYIKVWLAEWKDARAPPYPEANGQFLARLRAEGLRPSLSERSAAIILLILPIVVRVISSISGIALSSAGPVDVLLQACPGFGLTFVLLYRLRRRRMQIDLNRRALEHTKTGSDFILYLRSFNTANRLRVRNTMPNTLDRLLVGGHWDIEYALSHAFESSAPLVAIGTKGRGLGAAKIRTDDADWESLFRELASKAKAIMIVPSLTPGTRQEIMAIARSPDLLRKTIWIMPPSYWGLRSVVRWFTRRTNKKRWEAVRNELKGDIDLPRYRRRGALLYAGHNGTECKQFDADDLAEDRLRPFAETVMVAAQMEEDQRAAVIASLSMPRRSVRHHAEEWLYRRWIADLGSLFRLDLALLIVLAILAFVIANVVVGLTTGFALLGEVNTAATVMVPSLMPGDVLVMRKVPIDRGDIVPIAVRDEAHHSRGIRLSRIIALPGDRFKVERGVVIINDVAVAQQPVNDVLTGELSGWSVPASRCISENNSLSNGVQFRTVTCAANRSGQASEVKAQQNIAETLVGPERLIVMNDVRGIPVASLVNRADIGMRVSLVLFSVRQIQTNIFARIRWDRILKRI